jgi:hypothetical protein
MVTTDPEARLAAIEPPRVRRALSAWPIRTSKARFAPPTLALTLTLPYACATEEFAIAYATIKDVHESRIMIEPPVVRKLEATQSARDVLPCRDILEQQVVDDPVASRKVAAQFLVEIFRRAGNLTLWVLARQVNDIALMHAASACAAAPDMTIRCVRSRGRPAHGSLN